MSAPQTLIQAALNRLAARLGSGLADAAAELAARAQDAPERFRLEWQLFVEEVEQEAQRLEQPGPASTAGQAAWASSGVAAAGSGAARSEGEPAAPEPALSAQDQIDQLRARVALLARRLEDRG